MRLAEGFPPAPDPQLGFPSDAPAVPPSPRLRGRPPGLPASASASPPCAPAFWACGMHIAPEERCAGRVPGLGWRPVCPGRSGAFRGCEPGSSPSTFPARGAPEALGRVGGGDSEPRLRRARGFSGLRGPGRAGCGRTAGVTAGPPGSARPQRGVPPAAPGSRRPPPACQRSDAFGRRLVHGAGAFR